MLIDRTKLHSIAARARGRIAQCVRTPHSSALGLHAIESTSCRSSGGKTGRTPGPPTVDQAIQPIPGEPLPPVTDPCGARSTARAIAFVPRPRAISSTQRARAATQVPVRPARQRCSSTRRSPAVNRIVPSDFNHRDRGFFARFPVRMPPRICQPRGLSNLWDSALAGNSARCSPPDLEHPAGHDRDLSMSGIMLVAPCVPI